MMRNEIMWHHNTLGNFFVKEKKSIFHYDGLWGMWKIHNSDFWGMWKIKASEKFFFVNRIYTKNNLVSWVFLLISSFDFLSLWNRYVLQEISESIWFFFIWAWIGFSYLRYLWFILVSLLLRATKYHNLLLNLYFKS
jgi:hypothetical protein